MLSAIIDFDAYRLFKIISPVVAIISRNESEMIIVRTPDGTLLMRRHDESIRQSIPMTEDEFCIWLLRKADGTFSDPSKGLMEAEIDDETRLTDIEVVNERGEAFITWARMQIAEANSKERVAIGDVLWRYCELDILSVVWSFEYLRDQSVKN